MKARANQAGVHLAQTAWLVVLCAGTAVAAPDETALGKAADYPIAPKYGQYPQEAYMVGSYTHMDRLHPHCILPPASQPLPLPKAASEPSFRYKFDGKTLSLDDYMQRQRVTALLVLKDGEIVAERYGYGRTADMRYLSNSIAKTIVAIGIGNALADGLIGSLDDTAAKYEPRIAGTLYGETKIIDLLRMASGAKFIEDYTATDDRTAFNKVVRSKGAVEGIRSVTARESPAGERFDYSSSQTQVLALVLRAATKKTLCNYIGEKLWQPLGAESTATWLTNVPDGVELAGGNFNATPRDYARLGWLLANDGARDGVAVIPKDYVLRMTDASLQPLQFRPGTMPNHGSTYQGYGLQTWLLPGSHRKFALQGIYGQGIFVSPVLKLVIVHMAVGKDARGDASGTQLGAERDAMWRGVVARYGNW